MLRPRMTKRIFGDDRTFCALFTRTRSAPNNGKHRRRVFEKHGDRVVYPIEKG